MEPFNNKDQGSGAQDSRDLQPAPDPEQSEDTFL